MNELTEFEKSLLEGLNKRALLILKAEDVIKDAKITIDHEFLSQLPDETLEDIIKTWMPENQKKLRNSMGIETLSQGLHTTNGSKAKDKVSQLSFTKQLEIIASKLDQVASDYQFNPNDEGYLGFLNCAPIEEWSANEIYTLSIFLTRERKVFDKLLSERGLDIEAGADLEEIIFIEKQTK